MALNELENKINNIDDLGEDVNANIQGALRKFSRLSGSEIVTPEWLAKKMVDALPDDVTADNRFLNIAGKIGEFEYALCNKYGEEVKKNIYTIPTSGVTYECTRKMFRFLGIPIENVFADFTSYDLIDKKKNKEIMEKLMSIGFDVAIGNPPYDKEGNNTRNAPIYHLFYDTSFVLTPKTMLITPGRFLFKAGYTPDGWADKILNDSHFKIVEYIEDSKNVFPSITAEIKGGIAITYRDKDKKFGKIGLYTKLSELDTILEKVRSRENWVSIGMSNIISSQGVYKYSEKLFTEHPEVLSGQGKGTKAKITSKSFGKFSHIFKDEKRWREYEYGVSG